MATPNSIHTASPRATKRLARFFDVNPAPDSGFSIRIFLRTGTVQPTIGLRVCPQGNYGFVGCGSCERPARLWETAEKRSTQSLSRPGGSVKKKTQRSEFVFERRGEMVLIRSACIGNFLSSPSRDTEYERASLPSLPRLPDHSRRFVGWFIDLHV